MKLLKKREGFVLIESITAFAISILIISTLTYCVNEQFKLLNQWEQRVNAHKIILMNLEKNNFPKVVTIKNKQYSFKENQSGYQVSVGKDVYEMEK